MYRLRSLAKEGRQVDCGGLGVRVSGDRESVPRDDPYYLFVAVIVQKNRWAGLILTGPEFHKHAGTTGLTKGDFTLAVRNLDEPGQWGEYLSRWDSHFGTPQFGIPTQPFTGHNPDS